MKMRLFTLVTSCAFMIASSYAKVVTMNGFEISLETNNIEMVNKVAEQDLQTAVGIFNLAEEYRAHIWGIVQKTNPEIARTDNLKYFNSVFKVIITELAKAYFKIKGDAVDYTDNIFNVLSCVKIGYKKLQDYDDSNWNYFMLVNVINRAMNSGDTYVLGREFDTERLTTDAYQAIMNSSNMSVQNRDYRGYKKELDKARKDIKYYFETLELGKFRSNINEKIARLKKLSITTGENSYCFLYDIDEEPQELNKHLRISDSAKTGKIQIEKYEVVTDTTSELNDYNKTKCADRTKDFIQSLETLGFGKQIEDATRVKQLKNAKTLMRLKTMAEKARKEAEGDVYKYDPCVDLYNAILEVSTINEISKNSLRFGEYCTDDSILNSFVRGELFPEEDYDELGNIIETAATSEQRKKLSKKKDEIEKKYNFGMIYNILDTQSIYGLLTKYTDALINEKLNRIRQFFEQHKSKLTFLNDKKIQMKELIIACMHHAEE